ncbi:capsid assembly scaffolding protein Gp46 family protein [Neobacillus niacini]|uniref:DUF4355 domain-containing protein n=1 Tax=Neobacillus niacini TaxID=86668 RepID=UPI003B02977C
MESNKFLLPLDLQIFADLEPTPDPEPNPNLNPEPTPEPPAKTYTQEELEEIIKQRVSREKKAAEKAVAEAEKLAKMNEEEKKQFEFEKLQKELAEYKKKESFYSLSKEASKMLSENEISVDDDLLAFVVKETAEDTQAAVNSFVTLINAKVEEGVKKALAGKPPKVTTNNKTITKQQIMEEKDAIKRQKLIKENIHLFQ